MKRILLLDNYDSFTHNLAHQLISCGCDCEVMRNDDPRVMRQEWEADAVVLSPGPCTPAEAGCLMAFIGAYHRQLPMLGICLGHQALGVFFGAQLVRAEMPMHGKTSIISTAADPWIRAAGHTYPVMRYHSLVLRDLPKELQPLAWSEDGTIMALKHVEWPLFGLQFHPESIGTPGGQSLIESFVSQIP